MEIKELYIENFGKLSEYRKSFTSGLNTFLEDNGFGKTTLTVFIKAMFYGLDDTRKTSLDENERKRYTPWQSGAFGGWLIFTAGNKTYRIERSFAQKSSDDTFALYDISSGEISKDFSKNLGDELFGIDADGFERTVFLSEKNLSGKNTNQTISAKLGGLVGVEGDIGEFDSAIKLLDDRRRFYQKKGGAGEITDIRTEMYSLEEELRLLNEKKAAAAIYEKQLASAAESIAEKRKIKENLLAEEKKQTEEKQKNEKIKQYISLLDALRSDEEKEKEIDLFFSKKIPSTSELRETSEFEAEIKRLENSLETNAKNDEFSSLDRIFSGKITSDECEEITEFSRKIAVKKSKLGDVKAIPQASQIFIKVPEKQEIEIATKKLEDGKKHKKGGLDISLLIIGLSLTILGAVLGFLMYPFMFLFTLSGVLLTLGYIFNKKSSNSKDMRSENEVKEFIESVYGKPCNSDSAFSALITMRADLERYLAEKKLSDDKLNERELLIKDITDGERFISEFIYKFDIELNTNASIYQNLEYILRLYRRYEMLSESNAKNLENINASKKRIDMLKTHIAEFLSEFQTKTDDPIEEIRTKLAEYSVIKTSLFARRSDIQKFAITNGINPEDRIIINAAESSSELAAKITKNDEEIIAAERARTFVESEYNNAIRDIERIDELEVRILEYSEKIKLYEDNLSVINKAKELLGEAKRNMTAKYLGKTSEGFKKYISLIDGADFDFNMDTSFTVSKSDMGKSRQAEAYSRGTRDLYALALRLSLVDALYENETPPIILDDPFTSFDGKHTERAAAVLKKLGKDRQIFYFTCSSSRKI